MIDCLTYKGLIQYVIIISKGTICYYHFDKNDSLLLFLKKQFVIIVLMRIIHHYHF